MMGCVKNNLRCISGMKYVTLVDATIGPIRIIRPAVSFCSKFEFSCAVCTKYELNSLTCMMKLIP